MFCTKCGTRIADGSGVCTNCGVSVASTPIQPDSQVEQNVQTNTYVAQDVNMQANPYAAQNPNTYNNQMDPFSAQPVKKKSKKPLIITLIIVAIIAITATVLLILKPWADKDDKDDDKDKANTEVASTEKVIDDTWNETDAYHGEEMSIDEASDFASDFLRNLTNEEYDNAAKRLHPAIVDRYIGVVDNDNAELIKFLFAEIFYNDIVLDYSSSVVQGSSGSGWKAFAESLDNVDSYTQPIGYADAVISFDTYMSEGDGILEIALCDDGRYYITSIDMSGVVVTLE